MAWTSPPGFRCKRPQHLSPEQVTRHRFHRSRIRCALVPRRQHLTCWLSYQIIGIEEDRLCKPDRPFPSGRISPECGQYFYLAVASLAVAFSVCHGLTTVSLIYMFAIWLYNENGLSAQPLLKSPLGAVGYMCYAWGTTYIVSRCLEILISDFFRDWFGRSALGCHQPMNSTSITAIVASGLIFTMTASRRNP